MGGASCLKSDIGESARPVFHHPWACPKDLITPRKIETLQILGTGPRMTPSPTGRFHAVSSLFRRLPP
jgi:hypothetical protein